MDGVGEGAVAPGNLPVEAVDAQKVETEAAEMGDVGADCRLVVEAAPGEFAVVQRERRVVVHAP